MQNSNNIRMGSLNSCVVHDHQQVLEQIEEIDFFDDHRLKKRFFVPRIEGGHVEEILFTQILKCPKISSLPKKRSCHNNPNIVRLFGVNIITKKKKKRCSKKNHNSTSIYIEEQQNPNYYNTTPLSILHPWLLRHIQLSGGSLPELLFEKRLEKSDVNDCLGRLFVTRGEKLLEALTEGERRVVLDEESKRGIRVYTLDGEGRVYELFFKRWPSLRMFVLKHDWRKLCNANGLEKGDVVQGWGYRQNSEFRLALNFIRKNHG